ncbi:DUF4386 family protein [Patulibacter sp. NPDC049589]|uniref:DUF4386 family protein n=1 Tax=Patulibacter sp. NPDC049589 TaxID=3154731 RepID=UPI0034309F9C
MSTKTTVDLDREHVAGRAAGTAGFVATIGTFAALALASGVARGTPLADEGGQKVLVLQNLRENAGSETMVVVLRCLSVVLVIAVGLFFVKATADRDGRPAGVLRWLTAVAPLVLAAAIAGSYLAAHGAAQDFAAGAQTSARAEALLDDSGAVQATRVLEIAAHVLFGVWIVLLSWRAMACGLLTRTLGYWGVGAAVIGAFLPIGDALFMGWLVSLAFVAWGWWPGGLPRAWEEGRMIPWDDDSTSGAVAPGVGR